MIDREQILNSINHHRKQEINYNVNHPTIGRSDIILNDEKKTYWIVLGQNSANDVLPNTYNDVSVSRDAKLGGILIQNYEGVHTYTVRGKGEYFNNTVQIFNRAKYTPSSNENTLATDIIINISGDVETYFYRNLFEVSTKLRSLQQEMEKTQEELKKIETEQSIAQEKLSTTETTQKEELEKIRIAIAQKKNEAEELHKKADDEIRQQNIYLGSVQKFIRQNAELRWQPILDKDQDVIRRLKIFDGGTLIINGGPGTGKTTLLIQRIKFLISKTIEEYKSLNNKQREIIYNQNTGWIFFSPNELLALFLKNSMAQEGLAASDRTVKVWEEHKKAIIRLYGWLEEEKRIFKIYRPHNSEQETSLFSNPNCIKEILNDFIKFYLTRQRELLQDKIKTTGHIAINIKDITNINILFQTYFKFEWDKYKSKINEKERSGDQLERGEQGIFNKAITFFLNAIPVAYKAFRKEILRVEDKRWNLVMLKNFIEDKNQDLHSDEQAFLVYIVNTICYNIYQRYSTYLQETNHRYVNTYIKNCKPVIAIDEATDFSIIDLLAMHSFRHPDFSAVTLSGDLMQRITMYGLKTWEDFSDMIYSTEIKSLTLSYRQSPTLLSLAQKIHEYSTKRKTDYTSYMKNDASEPKPLMKISENENDKLNWIAQRIREIDTIYRQSVGSLPSVAVFVPAEENIDDFVSVLDEKLEGDIPVQGCHKGKVLGKSSDVRVYAVDKIKGLEFEAVFFHDLDQLTHLQDDILLKYLYVGLSRATFYLGVTLSKDLDDNLHFIEKSFVQNANWKLS
jgi:hypothetical protein